MWIMFSILLLTFIFLAIGNSGLARINSERPKLNPKKIPGVSVIIPAYKSEKTIEQTLKTLKEMSYPKKEIIVVNDSDDKTPQIARKYGAKVIQNKKRMGKSVSLDMATKKAKHDLLLFVDSDTTVEKGLLNKLVPWFYKPKVGVVMPTFEGRNKRGTAKMVAIENIFTHSHLRTHLYFDSLISFRGCCFAMRKNVIKKMGWWGKSITEDNDMGAKVAKSGHRIIWEPNAIVKTNEPETREELKKQKKRWGFGSIYTFFRHRWYYMKSPQFLMYFFPYLILGGAVSLLSLWYLTYAILTISIIPILNLIAELFIIGVASYFHITVLVYSERGFIRPSMLAKYIMYYLPMVSFFYFTGTLKGLKGKIKKKDEMDLSLW